MCDSGWIKLYRKLLDNPLWKDCTAQQKVVMVTLLLMANHEPKKWIFKGEEYECKAGQFITSLNSIQQEVGSDISIDQIRRSLVKLEKFGFLTNKSTNKNRLITIENWGLYQFKDEQPPSEPPSNRQATAKQPPTNKNVRIKECKDSIITNTKYVPLGSEDVEEQGKLNMQSQIDRVVEAWNKLDGVCHIRKVVPGTKRYKLLTARIKEFGLETVLECVVGVGHSSFLKGYTSSEGWKADFDWTVKPANFIKILEGRYADKPNQQRYSARQAPAKQAPINQFEHVENASKEEVDEFFR